MWCKKCKRFSLVNVRYYDHVRRLEYYCAKCNTLLGQVTGDAAEQLAKERNLIKEETI